MRKIIITILFVTFSAIAINAVGSTVARYSNSKTYRDNFFVAASLDFTVNNKKFRNSDDNDGLRPGDSVTQFATILNRGSLDFQYTVRAEPTDGDDSLCQVLSLEARLEGATPYLGKLIDFVSSPVTYSTTTDEWEFVISLPIETKVEGHCRFDFIFSGWQTTLPEFGGFSNIEKFDDPVHSVTLVTLEEATTTPIVVEEAIGEIEEIKETVEETEVEEAEIKETEPPADETELEVMIDETVIEEEPVEIIEIEPSSVKEPMVDPVVDPVVDPAVETVTEAVDDLTSDGL